MKHRKNLDINIMVDLYKQGLNTAEIAEKCGCCSSWVGKCLKLKGVKIARDYSKVRRNRINRINVNINFFKDINTEEQAYFLGMMFADGSVSEHQFYLKLKDEDVIVKFRDALECEYPIHHNTNPYDNFILEVSCKEMCDDLIKLGCIPNKTKTLRFPNIKSELLNHFVRGYMDGDGCIRVGMTPGKDLFDIVSAAYDFITDLKQILTPYTKHLDISKETNYDVWHLRCAGHQVKSLLNWIYKDSTIYMQRKYFKYQLISSR